MEDSEILRIGLPERIQLIVCIFTKILKSLYFE